MYIIQSVLLYSASSSSTFECYIYIQYIPPHCFKSLAHTEFIIWKCIFSSEPFLEEFTMCIMHCSSTHTEVQIRYCVPHLSLSLSPWKVPHIINITIIISLTIFIFLFVPAVIIELVLLSLLSS